MARPYQLGEPLPLTLDPLAAAVLPAAHDAAHVPRARRLAAVQLRVRGAGRQVPRGREGAGAAARHPAVDPDPRLPVDHRDRLHRAVPGQPARASSARRSSPSSPRRPGTWRSASTSRCAPCRPSCSEAARVFQLSGWQRFWRLELPFAMPGPAVEHDDVDVGRLVLRRRLGGDLGVEPEHQAARHRLLHRAGHRGSATCGAIGWAIGAHAGRHHAVRPAVLPAAARLGRQVPLRGGRQRDRADARGC